MPDANEPATGSAPTPVLSAPTYSTNQSPTSKFNVRWTADSADSYDVQYKIGVGGAWKSLKSGTTATSAYFTGDPGKTYYFRARAKKGGQTGAWSAKKSTVVPYNQSAMTYKGSWGSASASKIKEFTAPTSGELKVVVNHTKNSSSAGYRIELDGIAAKR